MGEQIVLRQSLTEQIKTILIDRIIDGTLMPGDRLKELQIAKEFGTSQAPVREAIRSLQALGYVEHKAHVGALVRTYNKKEIRDAYRVREALEAHSLISAKIDAAEFADHLKRQLDRIFNAYTAESARQFTEADTQFHRTIIECSGNLRMLEIWDSLRVQLQIIAMLVETHMPLKNLYALHQPIVNALEKGHKEGAARYLANHYQQIGRYWENLQ